MEHVNFSELISLIERLRLVDNDDPRLNECIEEYRALLSVEDFKYP